MEYLSNGNNSNTTVACEATFSQKQDLVWIFMFEFH
jgi:hypothetical protein